ncbi:MAG: M6 family metalloprotease domain-containing protein [Caldisericia bacterium]|nr:M6 family metalloprotease domain-containing protein [Caldisericia bacterium]
MRKKLNKFLHVKNKKTIFIIIFIILFINFFYLNSLKNSQIYGFEKDSYIILKPIVLLVEFPDLKSNSTISTPEYYQKTLFDKNNKSLYDYFQENSNKKLEILGKVYLNKNSESKWFVAPRNYDFYENNSFGMGKYPNNTQKLLEDIINITDEIIDFSQHDGNNDGFVDGIIIIYAGSSISTSDTKRIYPHSWSVSSLIKDKIKISKYVVISEYKNKPGDFVIGPLCHELGHLLGGIDLYDLDSHKNFYYDGHVSNGLGKWSIMAYGIWGKKDIRGDTPSHFDAWHKIYFGWIEPKIINEKEVYILIEPVEKGGFIYKINIPQNPNKYILIENRQKIGFDSDLPSEGILIYLVDESVKNNSLAYSPYKDTPNKGNYKVSILQKDSLFELERGKNYGDENDTFKTGDEFSLRSYFKNFNLSIEVKIKILEKVDLSYKLKIEIID